MQPILVVTRPEPHGRIFARAVDAHLKSDVTTIYAPAFQITPVAAQHVPDKIDHVIFTSANGVRHAPFAHGALAWCVGAVTAQVAKECGYAVRVADGDADALVAMMTYEAPPGVIVHYVGEHRRGRVADRLSEVGLNVKALTVYTQLNLRPPPALILAAMGSAPLVAPVFSPRSGRILIDLLPSAPLHLIAISAAVTSELKQLSAVSVLTLDKPDADAMIDATVCTLKRLRSI